ncbi:MAG: hypothetical protein V4641_26850 [Pseudomonadota bacterium]
MLAAILLASAVGAAAAQGAPAPARLADFQHESASEDVTRMAQWVLDSANNRSLSFMIIDKKNTKIFVFSPDGKLQGATPALLGGAVGDDSVPGIGNRKLSSILPEERTTPAGRFVAALDHNLGGKDILWVDYANAISLHRVVTSNPRENRARRLATPTTEDNRISYGCINVPAKFFDQVVIPVFRKSAGIVYILPETRPLGAVFTSFDRLARPAAP